MPRPLEPARAMRSRTCADVIQPCQWQSISFVYKIVVEIPEGWGVILVVKKMEILGRREGLREITSVVGSGYLELHIGGKQVLSSLCYPLLPK